MNKQSVLTMPVFYLTVLAILVVWASVALSAERDFCKGRDPNSVACLVQRTERWGLCRQVGDQTLICPLTETTVPPITRQKPGMRYYTWEDPDE